MIQLLSFSLKGHVLGRKRPFIAMLAFLAPLSILPFGLSNLGLSELSNAIVATGSIWVFILVTALALIDRIWPSHDNGIYALYGASNISFLSIYNAQALSFIVSTLLPLLLCLPLIALFWGLSVNVLALLLMTLMIGAFNIGYIVTWLGLLSLHVKQAYAILLFLGIPLMTPNVIFGLSTIEHNLSGLTALPDILLLVAYTMVNVLICQLLGHLTLQSMIGNRPTS